MKTFCLSLISFFVVFSKSTALANKKSIVCKTLIADLFRDNRSEYSTTNNNLDLLSQPNHTKIIERGEDPLDLSKITLKESSYDLILSRTSKLSDSQLKKQFHLKIEYSLLLLDLVKSNITDNSINEGSLLNRIKNLEILKNHLDQLLYSIETLLITKQVIADKEYEVFPEGDRTVNTIELENIRKAYRETENNYDIVLTRAEKLKLKSPNDSPEINNLTDPLNTQFIFNILNQLKIKAE